MPQKSLAEYVSRLDDAGLLTRYTDEKRVDELPSIMEAHPDTAVYVEHVKDCAFPFFANGYGARPMYALELDCDTRSIGQEMTKRAARREKPVVVDTAPCKDVVIRGDDVDLTIFPLFQHHPWDGQAYLNDTNVVSRNPDTGVLDQGIYRFMYRSKNELNIDMRNATHRARVAAELYQKRGQDMPISVLIGGPTLDKVASMMSYQGVDDWEVMGGFYGEPAKLVNSETNDLTIPANAEIVLEGRVITSEGWVHDEGPYGEYTGTYGGGLPRNNRFVVDCITHRKDAVYQYATIGGLHPGRTDMSAFQPAVEGDVYAALQSANILVKDVYLPPAGCSNIGYVSIKVRSGGDAKQALAVMLSSSRQWMPKIAYVFDEDVDIYDDERVKWALAWRFKPDTATVMLEGQNTLPLDPSLNADAPPVQLTKVGYDCTIPIIGDIDDFSFRAATVAEPLDVSADTPEMSEDDLLADMRSFIQDKPRPWRDVIARYASQPYPLVYRAFGQLRPHLGRVQDERPSYPYTFADGDFVNADQVTAGQSA